MIDLDRDEGVAVVTLRRPPVNAFSTDMWRRLTEIVDGFTGDRGVAAAVLTAEGTGVFSAGADTKETRDMTAAERQARAEVVRYGLRTLHRAAVPIVAAINGPAVGGGLNIATLCDVRIAAEGAHFSLPEIRHGALAGGGAFLHRIGVPMGVVRRMIYTGERIGAVEALAAGIVDEVVPFSELLARARAVAAAMAGHGRPALVRMKRAALAAERHLDWWEAYEAAAAAAGKVPEDG